MMACTMPLWQWFPVVWPQYTHTGLVSLSVMVHVVGDSTESDAVGVKPEKKPPARGWHGSGVQVSKQDSFPR